MSDKKTLVDMLNRNRLFDAFTEKDVLALIDYSQDVAHPEGQWIVIDGRTGVGFDMEPHTWEDSCHGCTYFAPAAPLVEVCQSD